MFTIALSNVLITLLYIVPGYVLYKTKCANATHLSTMSSMLIYVCAPCMIISSFMSLEYSVDNLKFMGLFFILTLLLQSAFMLLLFLIFRKKYENAIYRILTIGAVLGNVGFFGLPIVKALLPNNPEVACYSAIYMVSMNVLVFTMGIFCLTNERKYMTLKSVLTNPSSVAFYIAVPLYIMGARQYLPTTLVNALDIMGKMTTPVCMFILGVRLATVEFKKLFIRPMVYIISLAKLVVFPLFCYACVYFLPLPDSFKASILILGATPCAVFILSLAEIHHKEEELTANCVLVSTLLCFITIPLLVLLL